MCKVQSRVQKIVVLLSPLFNNQILMHYDVLLFAEISLDVIESSTQLSQDYVTG
jgi:hypothetical protein